MEPVPQTMTNVTIRSVAKEAGVSPSSVSRILNSVPGSSHNSETQRRVRAVAAQLNYRPHSMAAVMRAKRTYMVGVFLSNPRGSCSALMIDTMAQELRRHGRYKPMFVDPAVFRESDGTAFGLELLEGLFWSLPRSDDDLLRDLLTRPGNKPQVVAVGHQYPRDLSLSRVEVDLSEGSYQATEHLLKLGHTRIALLFQSAPCQERDRFSGFRRAMQDHGLTPDPSLCLEMPEESGTDSYFRAGLELTKRLFAVEENAPTAVVCHNDEVAVGVLRAAQQLGLRVPEDLSVVGFDGVPLSQYTSPSLTTVVQPVELQTVAVELMLARLDAGKKMRNEMRTLHCTLRIGESSAQPQQISRR